MIRSLAGRLTVLEQVTVIAAVLAFALSSLWITTRVLRVQRQAFVIQTARRLADALDDELLEEPDTLSAARNVLQDADGAGVRVEIRGAAGRWIAATPHPIARRGAARGGQVASSAPASFVASARSRSGVLIGVSASDAPVRASLSALAASLAIAALPILVVSLVLGRSLVARALRPLSVMADRAAALSVGRNARSLGERPGLEEIDRLAASFDRLLERLDDALRAERRLTADASHELRTPLTVLGGELEMALAHAPQGTPSALGLHRAVEQVRSMGELVEAILLLHRSGETGPNGDGAFELLNLCDLARDAVGEMRVRYPGRERDVVLDASDEILVRGHPALVGSALRNLLDNAFKFTHRGSRVRVAVAEGANEALLTVDDEGPGIPESEREHIFDPFYRGAESRAATGGFGLGLPILRRVARAHGGDAEVLPSPLGGARFVLRLPGVDAGKRGETDLPSTAETT